MQRIIYILFLLLNIAVLSRFQIIPATTNHSINQFNQEAIDTIIRTFQSLPPGERERLNVDLSTPMIAGTEASQMLVDAWTQRQAEIRQLFEKMVKPAEVMAQISRDLLNSSLPEHFVVDRLVELESLLADIDNARDFHTIGGWPVLISYLSPQRSERLRGLAALAVGTLVKNQYDYQLWVLDKQQISSSTIRNTVSHLIENFSCMDLLIEILKSSEIDDNSELLQRTLYAISSATRGNLEVQEYLSQHEYFLSSLSKVARVESIKIIRKVWSFVEDMLRESEEFNRFYTSQTDVGQRDISIVDFKPLGQYFCSVFWVEQSLSVISSLLTVEDHLQVIDYRYSKSALRKVLQLQLSICLGTLDTATINIASEALQHLDLAASNVEESFDVSIDSLE